MKRPLTGVVLVRDGIADSSPAVNPVLDTVYPARASPGRFPTRGRRSGSAALAGSRPGGENILHPIPLDIRKRARLPFSKTSTAVLMKIVSFPVLFTFAALCAGTAPAQFTLVDDGFNDGDRTDGVDLLDVAWFKRDNGSTVTVNAQAESSITGNGLFVDSNSTQRPVLAAFDAVPGDAVTYTPFTLGAAGSATSTLRLQFDIRIFSSGTTATSTTPSAQTGDSEFRFGIYNSNGTDVTADGASTSDNDFGYRAGFFVGSGAAANPGLREENGTNPVITSGSDSQLITQDGTPIAYRISTTATHSAIFSLTRTTAGVRLTLELYDAAGGGGTLVSYGTAEDTGAENNANSFTGVYTAFNEIAFSSSAVDYNFRLDNVLVTVVPEPGSAMLLMGGAAGFAARRRRRA